MKQQWMAFTALTLMSLSLPAQESLPTPEELEARRTKLNQTQQKFKDSHLKVRDLQSQIESGGLTEEELKKKEAELAKLKKERDQAADILEKGMSRTERKEIRAYKQYRSERLKAKEEGRPWPEETATSESTDAADPAAESTNDVTP